VAKVEFSVLGLAETWHEKRCWDAVRGPVEGCRMEYGWSISTMLQHVLNPQGHLRKGTVTNLSGYYQELYWSPEKEAELGSNNDWEYQVEKQTLSHSGAPPRQAVSWEIHQLKRGYRK
jgi:hypothetical protein